MPTDPDQPNLQELNQQAIDWLITLRADNISDEDMHGFADWLSQDAAHAAAFAEAEDTFNEMIAAGKSLRQKLSNSADVPITKSTQGIKSVIAVNPVITQKQPNQTKRWLAVPLALAAALLVVVMGVMPQQAHLFDAYLSDYHTGTGELRDIQLSDGSRLLLNTNSAVSVNYQDSLRIINLHHGQVRFTVAKDRNRPFEVQSGDLSVRALGTVFEVYHQESGGISVAVQEHAVSVRLSASEDIAPPEQSQAVVINEGQQLHYQGGNNLPAPQTSDISQLTAWQQQKLFINDRPLSEAIAELNRYRKGRIVVPDAKLNNQRITGVFSLVNPDETLHTLSAALALQQTNLGPWWVVLHR
ncbi:MAG: FecR domain-containing protein [Methylococcaceae bacterium]|nr:FecR domain-containing protein [Methylococcaceae bacterium]